MKTKKIEIVANCPLKKEWSEVEFKAMKMALKNAFVMQPLSTKDGTRIVYTYADLETLLGLPYTSSSKFAGVWVTNTELYSPNHPGYKYIGFAITKGGKFVGILWNEDENEILVQL